MARTARRWEGCLWLLKFAQDVDHRCCEGRCAAGSPMASQTAISVKRMSLCAHVCQDMPVEQR